MADKKTEQSEAPGSAKPQKLPRLPEHAKVQKRPLMRPPIESAYKNRDTPKVVYVSVKTPFMSAVNRVRNLLKEADKRATQSALSKKKKKDNHNQRVDPIMAAAQASIDKENKPEEVIIKATGRAIGKATELALYFQQQPEYSIMMSTDTVEVIDDIVEKPGTKRKRSDDEEEEEEELPETRVRRVGLLEVAVSLR